MKNTFSALAMAATAGLLAACGSSDDKGGDTSQDDAAESADVAKQMATAMATTLQDLVSAATALQAAAPTHAWDETDPSWSAMTAAWIQARHDYEQVEGATAPIYPNIDTSIDGRVEDFGPSGTGTLATTSDMFGTDGMSGLHAVERILWASPTLTPPSVVTYEASLGYVPAQAYPSTDAEAMEFKTVLCAKIISDAETLAAGWTASNIDVGSAFQGLVGLMNEQHEKVTLAGLHQEESRYSQRTMDDLRQNLAGTQNIYALFEPWLKTKSGGADVDAQILAGFTTLANLYASSTYAGVAFPQPPDDWSDLDPSAADLMTPFGTLYGAVTQATDATQSTSIVYQMNAAATLLGLPVFQG